ncbi:hypothetical protein NEHOM01_1664 [Nematocida homosporus]|uniref:uncharacterized protein n=1 Tax=Nematocida homosporus TaxID=1912981 RepID=UPI00221F37C6|nr:uncharacterized protein NEHOM01_1664 [Nematocida homosporus]KAI5186725.1 hypothetical protein NEHOM01_1664 [Nematocida homosporus]
MISNGNDKRLNCTFNDLCCFIKSKPRKVFPTDIWKCFFLLVLGHAWWCEGVAALTVKTGSNSQKSSISIPAPEPVKETEVLEIIYSLQTELIKDLDVTVCNIWHVGLYKRLNKFTEQFQNDHYPYLKRAQQKADKQALWNTCTQYLHENKNKYTKETLDQLIHGCMLKVYLEHLDLVLPPGRFQKEKPEQAKKAALRALMDIAFILKNQQLMDVPEAFSLDHVPAERFFNILALLMPPLTPTYNLDFIFAAPHLYNTPLRFFKWKFFNGGLSKDATQKLTTFFVDQIQCLSNVETESNQWQYTETLMTPTLAAHLRKLSIFRDFIDTSNCWLIIHKLYIKQIGMGACSANEQDHRVKAAAKKIASKKKFSDSTVHCRLYSFTDSSEVVFLSSKENQLFLLPDRLVLILETLDVPEDFFLYLFQTKPCTKIHLIFASSVANDKAGIEKVTQMFSKSKHKRRCFWPLG